VHNFQSAPNKKLRLTFMVYTSVLQIANYFDHFGYNDYIAIILASKTNDYNRPSKTFRKFCEFLDQFVNFWTFCEFSDLEIRFWFRESGFGAFPKPTSFVSGRIVKKISVLQVTIIHNVTRAQKNSLTLLRSSLNFSIRWNLNRVISFYKSYCIVSTEFCNEPKAKALKPFFVTAIISM